jgi:hypothetical protein
VNERSCGRGRAGPQRKARLASRTKTCNPKSVRQLINDIVDVTVAEMKKQKVLA